MPDPKPLPIAPTEVEAILTQESCLLLPHFTATDAFTLGTTLYHRLRSLSQKPCVINICLANSNQLLFHACTRSGTAPDNDRWVDRKRATVLRWGMSSWAMGRKLDGDEAKFAAKYMLGESAGTYAIHGGGVPIRVKGVEGIVGVLVVSGLAQHEDHAVCCEALEAFIEDSK